MMAVEVAGANRDDNAMANPAFDRTYRQYSELVFRSAFRVLGNAEDAEDVLQTVFLRFLRRDEQLGNIANPEQYLRRAAVNAALDVIRQRKQHSELPEGAKEPGRKADQELRSRLASALARIDAKWAEMFVLRFVEGYGNKEISEMLGISQTLVAVTLFRARQKLQNEIRLSSGSLAV